MLSAIFIAPFTAVVLIAAFGLFVMMRRKAARPDRYARGQCVECGHDIRASSCRCPECGSDLFAQGLAYWRARL